MLLINRKFSGLKLLLCWLFIFALPAITFNFCLNWLFELTVKANQNSIKSDLINEMSQFKSDARASSFLQRKLSDFFARNSSGIVKYDASRIRAKLEEELDIKVACLVSHGADTQNLSTDIDVFAQKYLNYLPIRLTQKYIVALNNQKQKSFNSARNKGLLRPLIKGLDPVKLRKSADAYLQQQLSLITEAPLIPGKVCRAVSGRFLGPIFLYYHSFERKKGSQTFIDGGVMLVVTARNLNMRKILLAAKKSSSKGIERDFASLSHRVKTYKSNNNAIITSFDEDSRRFYLTSTMQPQMIIDLIQRGTFFPFKLHEISERMPLLRVGIARKKLQHPLVEYHQAIVLGLKIFTLIGAVLFLQLYFFGFNFKAGIRLKTIVGIGFIMILPISLLLVAITTWHEFSRIDAKYQLEMQQQNELESIQNQFNNFLTSVQLQTLNFCKRLSKFGKNIDSVKAKLELAKFLQTSKANHVLLDLADRKRFAQSTTEAAGIEKNELDLMQISSRAVVNEICSGGKFNFEYLTGSREGLTTIDSVFVNEILNRWGRLFKYGRFRTGNRFSCAPVFAPDSAKINGILTAKFDQFVLIRLFIERFRAAESEESSLVDFYIARQTAMNTEFFKNDSSSVVEDPAMVNVLSSSLNGSSFAFSDPDANVCFVKNFVGYPLLAVVRAKPSQMVANHYSLFLPLTLFSALLLLFVFLVFGRIYLEPIASFIIITRRVISGDYSCRVDYEGNDEFAELKLAFDSMIAGLDQKQKLSKFVSKDVIQAVETDFEDRNAPVGEKIDASVVFLQLEGFSALENSENILEELQYFIEISENAAEKWGGVIDKIIEDTLMLVFRDGKNRISHAYSASAAVLEIVAELNKRNRKVKGGIASGLVVSGRIGSRLGKLDYTAIGDTVNLSARLKAQAVKAGKTGIIIAPSTIRKLKGLARVEFVERISIKGKSREYPLYELLELRKNTNV